MWALQIFSFDTSVVRCDRYWWFIAISSFWKNMTVLWSVRNIPKFKDRANWSRDTFQPMRRHACVYQQTNQNVAPVIKSVKDELTVLINISCNRIRALTIARNHWGVLTDSGPIAEVVASLAWLARFLIEANWSYKNSPGESVKICWDRTKQDWYYILTSTGQESKKQSS